MPKMSEEYLRARREEILEAAARAISQLGIQGASLSEIREAAGISSGALYHYFRTKDEMIAAIRERSAASDASFYETLEERDDASEALAEVVGSGMTINHGSPDNVDARLAVMLWSEALTSDAVMSGQLELVELWRHTAGRLVDRAIGEGSIPDHVDREAIVEVLTALSFGETVLESWQPGRINPDRVADTTRKLLRGELWN
ncbi:MAG: TetR/AcrR family transcriptional regulator [bacterium]|nr:TetR/AcrR family transcriptional regulator [bacterium]